MRTFVRLVRVVIGLTVSITLGARAGTTLAAEGPLQAQPLVQDTFAMEAYFSWDGSRIIFQGKDKGRDGPLQVFVCEFDRDRRTAARPAKVTDGLSNHECTFFSPDGNYIVYATGAGKVSEEDKVDFGGYPYFYDLSKEIWIAKLKGNKIAGKRRITRNGAYEAECSFSPPIRNLPGRPDGVYVLFTSSREGSLDLWIERVFDEQGEDVLDPAIQLTDTRTSQEGGAFFLSDHEIVYRTWEFDPADPKTEKMEKNRVNYRPMQIHLLDIKTGKDTLLTEGNARHWAPFPHPTGKKIVFAKRDFEQPDHNFDIYVLDVDTRQQRRITSQPGFEGYPVFHPAGDLIMFSRFDAVSHDFSLWVIPYEPK